MLKRGEESGDENGNFIRLSEPGSPDGQCENSGGRAADRCKRKIDSRTGGPPRTQKQSPR